MMNVHVMQPKNKFIINEFWNQEVYEYEEQGWYYCWFIRQ